MEYLYADIIAPDGEEVLLIGVPGEALLQRLMIDHPDMPVPVRPFPPTWWMD